MRQGSIARASDHHRSQNRELGTSRRVPPRCPAAVVDHLLETDACVAPLVERLPWAQVMTPDLQDPVPPGAPRSLDSLLLPLAFSSLTLSLTHSVSKKDRKPFPENLLSLVFCAPVGLISMSFLRGCRHLEDGPVFFKGSFALPNCLLSLFFRLLVSVVSCQDLCHSAF